jgi:hypothetical protein
LWASSRLLSLRRGRLRGGQRQLRRIVQDLSFLWREPAEASGLDLALAHLWRHCAQGLNSVFHRLAPVGRQAFELRVRRPEPVLLLWRQVLPGFHAPQHLLLAIGRHAVKALEPLLEFLLPIRRKAAKVPVVVERLTLLIERLTTVLV